MRTLAVDLGQKRVGLAITDGLGITAQGLETMMRGRATQDYSAIKEICLRESVHRCVVGLPLMMSGEVGDHAKAVLTWVRGLETELKDIPCGVETWDERLTSKEAERLMIHQDLSRKKRKKTSDQLAAILILQNYLESRRAGEEEE